MPPIEIPGRGALRLEHVVSDVNGTLAQRGALISGVAERLDAVRGVYRVHLLTADTFGTAHELAKALGVEVTTISGGADKAAYVARLGADATIAIGNGRNDAEMLRVAALGIAVLGPEGASTAALGAADLVCASIIEGLDLLLDERALIATLRP